MNQKWIKFDCCESEELISLTTHGNDHLCTGQMTIEISKASSQFPYLQIEGSCSNHEEQDFQGLSNLQLEHQEYLPFPYEYVSSNYDKELDACYESAAQKSNKDLFSFDISCKDIIVEEEIVVVISQHIIMMYSDYVKGSIKIQISF